jgi:3-methyladenine DNA glycosylase AlkD
MNLDSTPSDPQALFAGVLNALEMQGDSHCRDYATRSHPTELRVIGIKILDMRAVEKDLFRRLRDVPADDVVELVKTLVASDVLECRLVAYDILDRHKAAASSLECADIEALGVGLNNWLTVDSFVGLVAGLAWREGKIPDDVVHGWARSEDRWCRRAAVVCTVALNQKA